MFQFDNVLVAGTVLVRQDIESQNWESSAHTAGWAIYANGDAYFLGVVTAGSFSTGDPPPKVEIDANGAEAWVKFFSGAANEQIPATVSNAAIDPNTAELSFFLSEFPFISGSVVSWRGASGDGVGNSIYSFLSSPDPSDFGLFYLDDRMKFRLLNTQGTSPGSTNHPFQIGDDTGPNLRMDGDEIQFANNGVNAPGKINESGGTVTFGGPIVAANVQTGSFTAAATPGGAGGTSSTAVNFATAFANTPVRVFLTPRVSAPGAAVLRMFGVTGTTVNGFTCNINRTDTATTVFDYVAITDMG